MAYKRWLHSAFAVTSLALLLGCSDPTGTGNENGVTRIALQSDPGDYVGQGRSHVYTNADALIDVSRQFGSIRVSVHGDETWTGRFSTLRSSRPEVGMYHTADLNWEGEHRTCGTANGWFAIDEVAYSGESLTEIILRFEQSCTDVGSGPALHGEISWSAYDTTSPPGPITPPPADLWRPAPGIMSFGTYYLESEEGDYIGQGQVYGPGPVTVEGSGNSLAIQAGEDWRSEFYGMISIDQLEPGYYAGLQRAGFHNPVKGGFTWRGMARGCSEPLSWVVIDRIEFVADEVSRLFMRFEQKCSPNAPALRGAVDWIRP